jgi:hypothetical protein
MVPYLLVRIRGNHRLFSLGALMEKDGLNLRWFAIGYLAAICVEIFIPRFIEWLTEDATVTVLHSSNGNSGEKGEEVTSLVKEYTDNE